MSHVIKNLLAERRQLVTQRIPSTKRWLEQSLQHVEEIKDNISCYQQHLAEIDDALTALGASIPDGYPEDDQTQGGLEENANAGDPQ